MSKNTGLNDEQEARLATVLDKLVQDSKDGASVGDLDEVIRQHPDLEVELRELYATAMIASDLANSDELVIQSQESSDEGDAMKVPDFVPSDVGAMIGDYEIIKEVGRGGMGVVYQAHQHALNRIVAIKMIPNAAFASSQDLARLRAEAIAAARLSHPCIVPVYEVGESNGQPWFSMQFIEGTTLAEKLSDGPLSAEAAVKLLVPIVDAIGVAHEAGILHRDLKPSNILLSEAGEPFVTDFGLAKRLPSPGEPPPPSDHGSSGNLTATGAILGTPSWMSPEQAAGDADAITAVSDVYGLGAILYAMLTGQPPFQAATPFDTLLMVMEQDPIPIRVLNSRIDSGLEMIVMKCLQKPQDLRYASTDELLADLRAWLAGEPIAARQSTVMNVMTRLFRESHHIGVLQNWGLLWMWHSLVLLILCLTTNAFQFAKIESRSPYVGLWVVGLSSWAFVFWNLRRRSGPITFVERQIAHVWAGSMLASSALFWVESLLNEPVLTLSPVLGCIAGIVFLAKAGMLSGIFYLHATALFAGSILMAAMDNYFGRPNLSISLFGFISAVCFFVPGFKYFRLQRRGRRLKS